MNDKASRPRRRRTRAEWTEIVARYRASGLDRDSFSAREGVEPGTLGWWSSRLASGAKAAVTGPRRSRSAERSFVPVRVVDSAPAPVLAPGAKHTAKRKTEENAPVELVLAHGMVIRLDTERLSERAMTRVA